MDPAESLHGELSAAYLYRVIAAHEREPRKQRLFAELARDAEKQAAIWERKLREAGKLPPAFSPDRRTRLVGALVRLLGPARLMHALTAMKVRGMSVYRRAGFSGAITTLGASGLPTRHDEIGERHSGREAGGSLRAAVFGVSDGLVSNASLILGVAGAGTDNATILLTGIAGMLAGAFSMAAGEYVSVRSQREMYEYQIALERAELAEYPEEEAEELALIFQARGMSEADARSHAHALIADPNVALDTLTREELGLNPGELGSPRGAALSSFFSFVAGSALPLLPFFWMHGPGPLVVSIAFSAAGLFAVGAATSLFSGGRALSGGARMLAIGGAAGAVTYLIGKLVGVSLG
ncbi:MAG: VIT1/CCC1 transporter family protein [Betaproteobacteria bacterium]|nr:VIT1/CCC1 transporter family protein [Betaproteobacteria bacterium]